MAYMSFFLKRADLPATEWSDDLELYFNLLPVIFVLPLSHSMWPLPSTHHDPWPPQAEMDSLFYEPSALTPACAYFCPDYAAIREKSCDRSYKFVCEIPVGDVKQGVKFSHSDASANHTTGSAVTSQNTAAQTTIANHGETASTTVPQHTGAQPTTTQTETATTVQADTSPAMTTEMTTTAPSLTTATSPLGTTTTMSPGTTTASTSDAGDSSDSSETSTNSDYDVGTFGLGWCRDGLLLVLMCRCVISQSHVVCSVVKKSWIGVKEIF